MIEERRAESLPELPATFHFIGIGGIGMSALARILKIWGYTVTGSDAMESGQTAALREMGIPVVIGHDNPTFASQADVIVTNKRAAANARIELDAGIANGARVIKRGDLLGMAAGERMCIAVAGSHGKSTTSGMLSAALMHLDADPTFAIGAILGSTGTNAEPGHGKHFVAEADEFDRSFWGLFPDIAIITSVSFDHPDIYEDQADYDRAFVEFVRNIRPDGALVIAGDDAGSARVLDEVRALGRTDLTIQTFGETESCDWRLEGSAQDRVLFAPDGSAHQVRLKIPGKHNARNATAAIAALVACGFDVAQAVAGVESFTGIGRRFETKGEIHGVPVIDDYAHHPDEIVAVIDAAREHYPGRRVIAVHQPHTYSRTYSLMSEFANALDNADDIVLMDIYGVGEVNEHNITTSTMAERMRKPVRLVTGPQDAATNVGRILDTETNAVVLTVGAGTVTQVGPLLIQTVEQETE